MKAFTHKMSEQRCIGDLHDHHIFEQREAERDKAEHEEDLRWQSRQEYEQLERAGNPPEYDE